MRVAFEGSGLSRFIQYMQSGDVLADPIFQRLQDVPDRNVTCTRRDLVANRAWYYSSSFNDYRRIAGCDHQLTSVYQTNSQDGISTICLHRAIGERDFSAGERRLVDFFHVELGRLLGGALASAVAPGRAGLLPRLRQTLHCLLEGLSEKQVAGRLGITPSTVHQYVTILYRRFGVQSRAELMAHTRKRMTRSALPVADLQAGSRGFGNG